MEYKLIYNRAWSFHRTTGIELDELISEATLAYLEAEQTFSKDRGVSFITFAYTCMNNALVKYCEKTKKFKTIAVPAGDLEWMRTTVNEVNLSLSINLNKFSDNVKQVISYLFEHQDEFDLHRNLSAANRGRIANAFLQAGWSKTKVYNAINEIKQLVRDTPENELF